MKEYQTSQLRNVCLLGNSSSGKTTLAESMLYNTGETQRQGTIEAKNTISDFKEIEQDHGNSVFSSVMYAEYNDIKINLLDTPGLDDFCNGVISSLHVVDIALMLINAQHGVEVGSIIQDRYCDKSNKPMMFIINQLDHDKSNFKNCLTELQNKHKNKITILQYPVTEGENFNAIIDILAMKMYKFDNNGKTEIMDIPPDEQEKSKELRAKLIEKAAEGDDTLMETFFENENLTEEEIQIGLKETMLSRDSFPILCVSAKKSFGVKRLLDIITNICPSPEEVPSWKTEDGNEIKSDINSPFSAFVFKTSYESHVGEINYFNVVSGELKESMDMLNTSTNTKERIAQLFISNGKERTKVNKLVAGDIGATVKLKNTKTENTLTSSEQFQFPKTKFPNARFRTAIKAQDENNDEKLGTALHQISIEDPTIIVEYSKELKQIIIYGQGEYHLNILKWRLEHVFNIKTDFLTPKIPYRETITKISQGDYRHKKQSGGSGQFGEVHMVIEPYEPDKPDPSIYKIDGKEIKLSIKNKEEIDLPWGGKLIFYNCIVGGAIDSRFLPAILKGIMERMEEGPLTGSYARDIRVAIYDGKMHPVDSNEISFKIAGRQAFKEAFKNATPKILEPIYDVNIYVPDDKMGDVMSDLQSRRAIVQGMTTEDGFEKISAKIPLAELNKYSTTLNSLTNGRATYNMKFAIYNPVPPDVQKKLIDSYESTLKEE